MLTAVSAMIASAVRRTPALRSRTPASRRRRSDGAKAALLQPHAQRDEQQTDDERRGNGNEDDEPCVRVVEPTREHRDHQRDEQHS